MTDHVDAAHVLYEAAKREVSRIVAREAGAPYPYVAQRRAAQNALLVLGWDTTAAQIAGEDDAGLDVVANGLSLSATRATNTPAYMALEALVRAQPKGKQ